MPADVGPGIRDRMAAQGDHPLTDSQFENGRDGTFLVEKAYGTKGLYIASNASGQWETVGPLPAAE